MKQLLNQHGSFIAYRILKKCVFAYALIFYFLQLESIAEVKILPDSITKSIFTEEINNKFGINFNIFKSFEVSDFSGRCYYLLTEHHYGSKKETPHIDSIKGFKFKDENCSIKMIWSFKDFIINKDENEEKSIWFWTKFSEFMDIDEDGYIEPILVYGSTGMNGFDDGRVKILVYYKDIKYAIRHQNSILDFERYTKVDSSFYKLPQVVITHTKAIMKCLVENGNAIFTSGWEEAFNKKTLIIKEKSIAE